MVASKSAAKLPFWVASSKPNVLICKRMPRILEANFMTYLRNSAGILMVFCLVLYVFWTSTGNLVIFLFDFFVCLFHDKTTSTNISFVLFSFSWLLTPNWSVQPGQRN